MAPSELTEKDPRPRVGFIGMGLMGSRMATRLLTAEYPLTVYNRSRQRTAPLEARGAIVAESVAELAAGSDFVFSSLSDDAAVEMALLAENGAIPAAQAGTTFVETSTVSPFTARRLAGIAEEHGCSILDAPVLGTGIHAERGELTFLVGGKPEVLERCRPLMQAMGTQINHLGPNGAGLTMKLAVNMLLGIGGQAIAEALALGQKAGLDKGQMLDVIGQCSMVSPAHRSRLESARLNDYSSISLRLGLLHKDLKLALQLAAENSVPMPATSAAHQMYSAEMARGSAEEDYSAVFRLMQQLAGL